MPIQMHRMVGVVGVDAARGCQSRVSRIGRDIDADDEDVLYEARRNEGPDDLEQGQ